MSRSRDIQEQSRARIAGTRSHANRHTKTVLNKKPKRIDFETKSSFNKVTKTMNQVIRILKRLSSYRAVFESESAPGCIVTCHVKCRLLACCISSGLDAHCVL